MNENESGCKAFECSLFCVYCGWEKIESERNNNENEISKINNMYDMILSS